MRGTRFAELSAFVAVAELSSFTKAAQQLGISTATLSQTIRALEESLGVRLLNRTTRSVSPTEAGERLLVQLRPLLDGFDTAIESVNTFREKPAGHLKLTMPPPVAQFVLRPLLARFTEQFPQITLEISAQSALADIVAERYDAGIRVSSLLAKDMIAMRITDEVRYAVVASPAYLARRGRPQGPADLHAHSCIRLRLSAGMFIPWKFIIQGRTVEVEVEGPLIVDDPELVVSAALDGIGIAYIDEDYVTSNIVDGRLVRVLEDAVLPTTDGFFLYYSSRRQNSAALRAFIDFLHISVHARPTRRR
jgi:DNA-binding transcriptional LysR family regulator